MSLFATQKAPRCLSCLSKSLTSELPSLFSPVQIQVRGKKRKLPKCPTITVRLTKDVQFYGRKGTILAIAPARMRNHLYPSSRAEYMTAAETKQAVLDELVMERDASFGTVKEQKAINETKDVRSDMRLISPQRTRELLEQIIPETLEFERKPIIANSTASAELGSFIFGSVSTLDILMNINAHMTTKAQEAGFDDAGKVVLSSSDIQIDTEGLAADTAEGDRIKALGVFTITINLRQVEPVMRKIKIMPLVGADS